MRIYVNVCQECGNTEESAEDKDETQCPECGGLVLVEGIGWIRCDPTKEK